MKGLRFIIWAAGRIYRRKISPYLPHLKITFSIFLILLSVGIGMMLMKDLADKQSARIKKFKDPSEMSLALSIGILNGDEFHSIMFEFNNDFDEAAKSRSLGIDKRQFFEQQLSLFRDFEEMRDCYSRNLKNADECHNKIAAEERERSEAQAHEAQRAKELHDSQMLDLAYLTKNFGTSAETSCTSSVEDFLNKNTKYNHKWDTAPLDFFVKFDSKRSYLNGYGSFSIESKNFQIANKYGTMMNSTIYCVYDAVNEKVSDYNLSRYSDE